MELRELNPSDIVPFEADLIMKDVRIGKICGSFDRSQFTSSFFNELAKYDDTDPRLVVAFVSWVERSLVSWDLTDEGEPAPFARIWDVPPQFAAQIAEGMFKALGGEPPKYLRGIV